MATTPTIATADCLGSSAASGTTHSVSHQAYNAGDLVALHYSLDTDGVAATITQPSAGPDSETIVNIRNNDNGNAAGPHMSICYFIGASTQIAGTIDFTTSQTGRFVAMSVLKPAGTFNSGDVIGTVDGFNDDFATSATTPALTAASADADGLLVAWASVNENATIYLNGTDGGWSRGELERYSTLLSGQLESRDAAVTDSESISAGDGTWSITGGSQYSGVQAYILNGYSAGTNTDVNYSGANRGILRGIGRGIG